MFEGVCHLQGKGIEDWWRDFMETEIVVVLVKDSGGICECAH